MIVRSLEVEGVRCFAGPARIDFARDGFTILSGPNGAGKSTLVEAMRRCLLDAHNGAAAESLRPWSGGRSPRVVLEFDCGGASYLLTKQFLTKKQARLERKDGRSWRIVEEGHEADEAVRRLLRAAGRGDSGLLGVLWSPQGELPMGGVPAGVVEDIRASLGAHMAGAAGVAFEKHLRKLYESCWQPARKQPKRGRLHEIDEQLARARAAAESARGSLREAEQHAESAAALRRDIERLRGNLAAAEVELTTASERAALRERLAATAAECAREHDQHTQLLEPLWHRAESIRTESARRAQFRAAAPALVAAVEEKRRLEREASDAANAAKIAEIEETLARAAEFARSADAITAELATLRAPDAAMLKRMRDAAERGKLARVRLETLDLRLDVRAESALEVEVGGGAPSGRHELNTGASISIRGERVAIRIPGVASLAVAGPETDRAAHEKAAKAAEMELRALCAPFGETDLDTLAVRGDRRRQLEMDARSIAEARAELFRPRPEAQLRAELDRLAAQPRPAAAPDPDAGRKLLARRTERQLAENALALNASQLEDCERRLRELESDGKTGDRRGQELDEIRARRDSAAQRLAAARDELARMPASLQESADALRLRAAQLAQSISDGERRAAEHEAARRTLLSLGPYTSLAEAEEEISALEQERGREMLRLDGIRLLYETFDDEKSKALDGIAGPVSARATGILARFAGDGFATLTLSPDFAETAVLPAAKGEAAALGELSGGEREQIALAVRLALAAYLSESERRLIVLDDVLLNTDSPRLGRILSYLEEMRDRLQVLIVTCHPERYKRMRGARHVTLPLAAAVAAD